MPVHLGPLAPEEQFDAYSFVKYTRVIGRAYRFQAMEMVTLTGLFLEDLQAPQHDVTCDLLFWVLLRKVLLAADVALHSATEAGKKLTDQASNAFADAEKMMRLYERSVYPSLSTIGVSQRMAQAKTSDHRSLGLLGLNQLAGRLDTNDAPSVPVYFVLLRCLADPEPAIVHQILSTRPTIVEILWNFSRYTDDRRITLSQNPHFSLNPPRSGDVNKSEFPLFSSKDFIPVRNSDTIYVVTERPSRSQVFFHTGHGCQIFASGNTWVPGDTLIFKDDRKRLKKGRILRCDTFHWRHWQ